MELNRREFIGTTAGGAAGLMAATQSPQSRQRTKEIDALFDRAIVIDALSLSSSEGAGSGPDAITNDLIKHSGYTAIQTTLSGGRRRSEPGPWSEGNFDAAMADLKTWQGRIREHADRLIHCTKAADIERAKKEGSLAVILGFQNAPYQDDVANVNKLYEAGCRCVQLTYNSRNNLGDGCTERLQTGLSDFGIACVQRMDELGMMVDLSHCGEGTSSDGIAFSKHPCYTHTFCQALHFHPRGKSDALLRAIADKGGIAAICTVGYFLTPGPQATLEDYIKHLDHAVKVCGIEHVGMSTDTPLRGRVATTDREVFMKSRNANFKPNYVPRWAWSPELDKVDRYRTVAHALAHRGYKTAEIERLLGGNWLRYLKEVFRG